MDENIRNSLVCQFDFEGCDKRVLGVIDGKWCCGRCQIKLEEKMMMLRRKMFEIAERELEKELKQGEEKW